MLSEVSNLRRRPPIVLQDSQSMSIRLELVTVGIVNDEFGIYLYKKSSQCCLEDLYVVFRPIMKKHGLASVSVVPFLDKKKCSNFRDGWSWKRQFRVSLEVGSSVCIRCELNQYKKSQLSNINMRLIGGVHHVLGFQPKEYSKNHNRMGQEKWSSSESYG